jgi:SAM-dependent methyltransferase
MTKASSSRPPMASTPASCRTGTSTKCTSDTTLLGNCGHVRSQMAGVNSLIARVMEWPPVYRLWMAPFAEQKLRPIRAHTDLTRVRRVLDVGCGPGTNTTLFSDADYLGIDINESYIESARRRHRRAFVTADVTTYRGADHQRFDLILVNSLLRHLDDSSLLDCSSTSLD